MATLICNATGNLTGASTFAAAETGALAAVLNRNTIESLANNANVTSATFTVTSAHVIDAVLLWIRQSAAGSTGTFKVDLQKGGVSQASVTVNRTDLPGQAPSGSNTIGLLVPVLFKLSSTATGDGGSNWTIVLTNSNGNNAVNYAAATASTTNFTRALRTTTAATPAAADDLYVIGELTGAGTSTARTVTMDQTATTAYGNGSVNSPTVAGGGIHIGYFGTLSYGIAASTNYVLRINGDLWVWEQGPLNIGSSGSEIPRNSSAVLEIQQASVTGDFGLRCMDNSVVNIAGLSRTAAKAIVRCKLTADVSSSTNLALSVSSQTGTINAGALSASGSLTADSLTDTVASANHGVSFAGTVVSNTVQTGEVWLARGSGLNNRFVRVTMGNSSAQTAVTNGFFSDIDLQAGTAGTVTVAGNGTATSVSITALGTGWLIRMTGKVSSGSATTNLLVNAQAVSGTSVYAGNATQNFIYDHAAIVTASSIADTTFSVDTDTGWLSGDAICVASTTRTAADCEDFVLNANAGASSMVSGLYPFGSGTGTLSNSTHSGTSPTQAEIGLLTRNVKIRSTSSSLMTYMYCTASATVSVSWAEFQYLGLASTNKRGIDCDATPSGNASAKSFTYCSLRDFAAFGITNLGGGNSLNVTFSNNVSYNNAASPAVTLQSTLTLTDWTFDNNLIMKSANIGFTLADVGGACTNNTVTGCSSTAFSLLESSGVVGIFTGNVAHSNAAVGVSVSGNGIVGTLGFSAWRNSNVGFQISTIQCDLTFSNLTLFGNTTQNMTISGGDYFGFTGTNVICADTTFATTHGITFNNPDLLQFDFANIDMSGTGGIYAPHTTDDILFTAGTLANIRGIANNCKFGASTPISMTKSNWNSRSYLGLERYNQTAGDHRTEMTYGQLKTDTSVFNTASPSMRMTPNNASNKLESAPRGMGWKVPVSSGNTAAISVYLYKSKTGDGAAYTGNQPRLVQRANAALGQTSDVVLGTYSASTGSWNQLSANTSTATDDGAWEIIVDCDGTAGWINVDDLQVA